MNNEQHSPFHIPAEHRCEFHPAHHGLRLRHFHYDDAAIPHANVWRGYNTLRAAGNHNFCGYCVAIKKLRHLAAALADPANLYHRLNHCHLCFNTYRRPHLTTYSWCGTHSDQHLLYAVQSAHKVVNDEKSAGRCRNIERIDGRFLRYARPACRTVLHPE